MKSNKCKYLYIGKTSFNRKVAIYSPFMFEYDYSHLTPTLVVFQVINRLQFISLNSNDINVENYSFKKRSTKASTFQPR